MKRSYLNELYTYLKKQKVVQADINKVLDDYEMLFDEAKDAGLSDEEVIQRLGSAESIYHNMKGDLNHYQNKWNKLVAISPFVALITFFLLGNLVKGGYTYGWLAFLLIPVIAILVNVEGKDKVVALTPFAAVVTFFTVGFTTGLWHPIWLVFLIIPITAISLNVKAKDGKFIALSPLLITVAYILIGYFYAPFYAYGYFLYALVGLIAIFTNKLTLSRLITAGLILVAVTLHLSLFFFTEYADIAYLAYLIPVAFALLSGDIKFEANGKSLWKDAPLMAAIILLILAAYALVFIFVEGERSWTWIILLLIPVVLIIKGNGFKNIVAFTPFVALAAFMLIGRFFEGFQFAWLVFLIVPITGILESKDTFKKNDE